MDACVIKHALCVNTLDGWQEDIVRQSVGLDVSPEGYAAKLQQQLQQTRKVRGHKELQFKSEDDLEDEPESLEARDIYKDFFAEEDDAVCEGLAIAASWESKHVGWTAILKRHLQLRAVRLYLCKHKSLIYAF